MSLIYSVLVILTPIFADCLHIKVESPVRSNYSSDEIIIKSGDSLNLTCVGDTPLVWDYPTFNDSVAVTEIKEAKLGNQFHSYLFINYAEYLHTGYFMCSPVNSGVTSAKIYVYVEDDEHLLAVNESVIIIIEKQYNNLIIPCRPTSPYVNVTLSISDEPVYDLEFDPRNGFLKKNVQIFDTGHYMCEAVKDINPEYFYMQVIINTHVDSIAKPVIDYSKASHVLVGQTAILVCSVNVDPGIIVTVDWVLPNPKLQKGNHVVIEQVPNEKIGDPARKIIEYRRLIINNVTTLDTGRYQCNVSDHASNTNNHFYDLEVYEKNAPFLNLSFTGTSSSNVFYAFSATPSHSFVVNIASFPAVTKIHWFNRTGREIMDDKVDGKYNILNTGSTSKLTINKLNVYDSGIYSVTIENGVDKKSLSATLVVMGIPIVKLRTDNYYEIGRTHDVTCNIIGYNSNVTWYYKICDTYPDCKGGYAAIPGNQIVNTVVEEVYMDSKLHLTSNHSLLLMCQACNNISGCNNETDRFLVSDIDDGFDISGPQRLVAGDRAVISCGISHFDFKPGSNLIWEFEDKKGNSFMLDKNMHTYKLIQMKEHDTKYSHYSDLIFLHVAASMAGTYKCKLNGSDSNDLEKTHHLIVVSEVKPSFTFVTFKGESEKVIEKNEIKWVCSAEGSPSPEISWWKDGNEIKEDKKIINGSEKLHVQFSKDKSEIKILNIVKEDEGEYTCQAKNRVDVISKKVVLKVIPEFVPDSKVAYWTSFFAAFVFVCSLIIILLICRVKKEKELRKQKQYHLPDAIIERFYGGAIEHINPELDIGEQAASLPYDQRFEIPRERLTLGKQLGSGAFGVVLKGELEVPPDERKTVAVKMVKENVDESHITALISELKIMIHLGRHINVVNLIGACTSNLSNRELLVVVEYCPFGNLHRFLMKHRENFINQVNQNTGRIDTTIISSVPKSKYVNVPYINSTSNGSAQLNSQSEDNQQLNSAGSEVTSVTTPIGEDGYLICKPPQEWEQSKLYESKANQPISTQDLLCWSFQIARGMDYLATRKILHGDLAARNILLADNNIVKICDFGLSKNMYKDDNYFKKGKRLLPVKWMALEAIRDRNFSIQSDVWAYGIVLWELFSLARTPYPGLEDVERLYHKLEEGYRMEIPPYATKELYEVMMDCWQASPALRPSFMNLTVKLGNMLEDSVRKHYVDLNDPFLAENAEYLSQTDYLSMLSTPNYANLDVETGEGLNPGTSGYLTMRQHRDSDDAQEETELRPMLDSVSGRNGSTSEVDSTPNSPAAISSPTGNFVSVADAAAQSFSNPTYHNLDRPPINPYINTPYVVEKEGKPFGLQWNSSETTAV